MKTNKTILLGLATILLALVALSASATPSSTYYIYDESGHMIGEYDQNGNMVQEHIYLNDRPVAVATTSGMNYVTTDQLGTPRAVTDATGTVEWSWTSDPFGNGQPTGSLTYNLRFPGQYYDAETGHSYNYHRDYDPPTGRYIESDPIGLDGGLNTYSYVLDRPLTYVDPLGLINPAEATCVDPAQPLCWGGVATDILSQIIITSAVSKLASECPNNGKCPPCSPYPAGTIGWTRLDTSHTHFPVMGPHLHLRQVNQRKSDCKCFWNDLNPPAAPPPLPGWVDLTRGEPELTP